MARIILNQFVIFKRFSKLLDNVSIFVYYQLLLIRFNHVYHRGVLTYVT